MKSGGAGDHLLRVLNAEGSVLYSRFYDGTPEAHEALLRGAGLDEGPFSSVEFAMDLAVNQLEEAGLVITKTLPDLLADGNRDYRITLTDRGRSFLAGGGRFAYRGVDMAAGAVPALPWRPQKDDPEDRFPGGEEELSEQSVASRVAWCSGQIEGGRCGAVGLELGSAILVFGKRPAAAVARDATLPRRELDIVRGGLEAAGAEEIFHLVIGSAYLLLARPAGVPLYDPTPVGHDQAWEEFETYHRVLDRLGVLARRASRGVARKGNK